MMKKIDPTKKKAIMDVLQKQGPKNISTNTVRQLAQQHGVHPTTVWRWKKELVDKIYATQRPKPQQDPRQDATFHLSRPINTLPSYDEFRSMTEPKPHPFHTQTKNEWLASLALQVGFLAQQLQVVSNHLERLSLQGQKERQ